MPSVVLFQSVSQYQSLNTMAQELAEAWRARGVSARLIDLRVSGYDAIAEALAAGPRAAITISGYGIVDPGASDRLHALYRDSGVPVVSLYFDPLFYYLNQLGKALPRRLVATTSDAEVPWWRARPAPPDDIRFLPHGAAPVSHPPSSWDERDIPLLLTGTGPRDPAEIRLDWAGHGRAVADLLNRALEIVTAAAGPRSLIEALTEAADGRFDPADPAALQPWFVTLDIYLRARLRWRLVSGLADRPLTVAGDGWEALARRLEGRRVRFLPALDAGRVRALTGRSRIVLNSCTGHHGSHERVFQAMAAGAVAATTPTGWFDRAAPAGALLRLDVEREAPGPAVDALLADPARAQAMAEAGRAWFLAGQTWAHRTTTLDGWIDGL